MNLKDSIILDHVESIRDIAKFYNNGKNNEKLLVFDTWRC